MTKDEWDFCFAWLSELYPNFSPTIATSSVWYEELGAGLSPSEFKSTIRGVMAISNSAFVPSVSQVLSYLRSANDDDVELLAEIEWEKVLWNRAISDPRTQRAFRLIGNLPNLRFVDFDELKWIKKKFLKHWVEGAEKTSSLMIEKKTKQIEAK